MESLSENKPLRNSLMATGAFVMMLALEISPSLNESFQISPFPNDTIRNKVAITLVADFIGSWLIENSLAIVFK